MNGLVDLLKNVYGGKFDDLKVIRDFIGCVYEVRRGSEHFALKLYRPQMSGCAESSAMVMARLSEYGIRVPKIVKTFDGCDTCEVCHNGEVRRGILMEFITGDDVNGNDYAISKLLGDIRAAMVGCELPEHAEAFYIDRYIRIMREQGIIRAEDFAKMGHALYSSAKKAGEGFCHGDFHAGNMLRMKDGQTAIIDFDASANALPAYDIATYCDATQYFDSDPKKLIAGFDQTLKHIEAFSRGISVTDADIAAFPAFLAIRHFDIQATIIDALGNDCVKPDFYEEQYIWLSNWIETSSIRGFSLV